MIKKQSVSPNTSVLSPLTTYRSPRQWCGKYFCRWKKEGLKCRFCTAQIAKSRKVLLIVSFAAVTCSENYCYELKTSIFVLLIEVIICSLWLLLCELPFWKISIEVLQFGYIRFHIGLHWVKDSSMHWECPFMLSI